MNVFGLWSFALTGWSGWTRTLNWAKFLAMCASPLLTGSSSLCRGPVAVQWDVLYCELLPPEDQSTTFCPSILVSVTTFIHVKVHGEFSIKIVSHS